MITINTTSTTQTLITKGTDGRGNIKKILVTNVSANPGVVSLFLEDASAVKYYFLVNQVIPPKTPLVIEDCLSFNSSVYNLKMTNSGTAPALTIIIK